MEIIKPSEISGKIMSLIEDANKFVIIVSPYYKLSSWDKLTNRIDAAKKRGIEFIFFARKPESNSDYQCILEVKRMGFTPIEIERLHAKIYLNESEAIISSMNLNISSDTNSLDIAVKTQSEDEYKEVFRFYEKYIKQSAGISNMLNLETFMERLDNLLKTVFEREPYLEFDEKSILIKGRNRYQVFINDEKGGSLNINCVLSGKEFDFLQQNPSLFQKGKMEIELEEGKGNSYSLVWGNLRNIKTYSFEKLTEENAETLLNAIVGFVKGIEAMKDLVRNK